MVLYCRRESSGARSSVGLLGTDKQAQGCAGEGLNPESPASPHARVHVQNVPFWVVYHLQLVAPACGHSLCAFAEASKHLFPEFLGRHDIILTVMLLSMRMRVCLHVSAVCGVCFVSCVCRCRRP